MRISQSEYEGTVSFMMEKGKKDVTAEYIYTPFKLRGASRGGGLATVVITFHQTQVVS